MNVNMNIGFRKKFLSALLMVTCVLGLTACGSEETISDFQQSKIAAAESRATSVIDLTMLLVQQEDVDELTTMYSNVELADLFASTYSQYTQDSSFTAEGKGVKSAFTSFDEGLEAMGSVTEIGTPESKVDDDTIIVTVPVTGENASGSVELIFSNDIYLKMESCTLNIDQTFGQLMSKAAMNTLIGMCTVFVVLILISFIISLFGFIPKIQAKFAKKEEPAKPAAAPAAPVVVEEEELADDTELVAVIAAAIAAYEGTSTDGFTVRSIKRANTNKWKKA